MFGLENRGETLIFMLRHFDKTIQFDFAFFPFWCTKTLIGDYFVLRKKLNSIFQTKNWMFYSL